MAASHPERRGPALALLALAALAPSGLAQSPPSGDITLDAASSEVDYRSNTLLFRDVVITQARTRVAAQRARATGLDFDNATWTLSGAVRIEVDGGALRSDEATVAFLGHRVARATIRGQQAEFEQGLKTGGKAQGRAGTITYDQSTGNVILRGDAWLSDAGGNEIRGEQLVYDLRAQRVQAGQAAGSSERVRIIIRPPGAPPGTPRP